MQVNKKKKIIEISIDKVKIENTLLLNKKRIEKIETFCEFPFKTYESLRNKLFSI